MVEKDKKLVPYKISRADNGDAWVEIRRQDLFAARRSPPSCCRR